MVCDHYDDLFTFKTHNGSAVPLTCFPNGTGIYEVGAGGTCELSSSVAGKSQLLTAYYVLGGAVLYVGAKVMMKEGNERRARRDAASASGPGNPEQPASGAPAEKTEHTRLVQRSVLTHTPLPGAEAAGFRAQLESPALMFTWIGVAIIASNLGDSYLGNIKQNTFTLSENNAMDDADSVTEVVKDVFSFFEDGMTVLIGAAVGAGDTAGAGTLTALGFIGGITSGVLGGAAGTAAALTPTIMHLVIPAPETVGGADCASGAGGGQVADQAELERLAMPYWLLSVWSWMFSFCNNVGTGVVLGTNSSFAYALAVVCGQGVKILSFVLLAETIGHSTAAGLSTLVGSFGYFVVICHTVFFYTPTKSLVPRPSWAEFCSADTWRLTCVAARAGFAMMVNMLAAQATGTVSTQMLARMSMGWQYRASLFSTINGNFWMVSVLGYVMRLSGSKWWGAKWWGAFFWIAGLCIKGTLLLAAAAAAVTVFFHGSAPWSFASHSICTLLQSTCTSPVYAQLYGNDFSSTYLVNAILPQLVGVVGTLQACLFAAQDFDFVRNVAVVSAVCCYTPLAVAGYMHGSFLLLQVAPHVSTLFVCAASSWRLRSLMRRALEPGGVSAGGAGGGGGDSQRGGAGSIQESLL